MESDEGYSEDVQDDGPLSKIGNSFMMLCLGMVLFPIALFLLGWNENNYVCENNRILYGETNAKEVGCDSSSVFNKFVYFSCPFQPSSLETFTPCTFNRQNVMSCAAGTQPPIRFQSVSARQTAEMLQCTESCETKTEKNSL